MYIDRSIIARDPFQCLDALGVGQLVELAVESFRQNEGSIKVRYFDLPNHLVILIQTMYYNIRLTLSAVKCQIQFPFAMLTKLA